MTDDSHLHYLSEVPFFKDLEPWELRRLHYDISVAFKNAFKKPPERPQDRAKRIWKLVRLIRKKRIAIIPDEYLDIWDEVAFGLLVDLGELTDEQKDQAHKGLKATASCLYQIAKQSGDTKGGPRRNDGLYTVVNRLAMLFWQRTGRTITHTVPAYEDQLPSEFDQFAEAAFKEHYRFGPIPWRAVAEACREAAMFEQIDDTSDNLNFFNVITPAVSVFFREKKIVDHVSNIKLETEFVLSAQKQATKPKQQSIRRDPQGVGAVAGCPGGP